MSGPVRDAIAASLETLERSTAIPVAPFGYGLDLSCTDDVTETMAEVDPFSTRALAEASVRRLDCPRGALPGDADYGIDLRSYLNRGTTADEVRALAGAIRGELTKDDRIDAVTVTVTSSPTGSTLAVQLAITPVDARIGPFALTLAVTTAAVLIEELRAL